MLPNVITLLEAPEVVWVEGVAEALMVPFAVLEADTVKPELAGMARVVDPAATVAGAVPATRAALAVDEPETVVKMTCGTVTAVLITVVLEEDGMIDPAEIPVVSVHGTTSVV